MLGARRTAGPLSGQITVADAETAGKTVKKFIEIQHAQSRPRWRKERERLLTKHFLSKYKDVPLNRIKVKDILAVTDALKELPSEQLHTHRSLKTLFTWARKREMISVSSLDDLARPSEAVERERVLSDKELRPTRDAGVDL